ncbi:MAG: MFS transporter [Acidimicrobiales bacterium]
MRRLLAIPNARLYLGGQALSIFGDTALWLAAGIWVKTLTGSNALAGLTFFFFALPSLLSPLSGLLVDRVRRRPLLVVTNLCTGAVVLLLLLVHGRGDVWLVYTVMVAYGMAYGVLGSGQSALLTVIVPDELLGDANGLLRTVREGLRLVSPLVGAGLFVVLGGGAVAVLDAVTFVAAAISLLLVKVDEPAPAPRARGERWLAGVTAGFRHISSTAVLRQMTIACAAVLLVVGFAETAVFALVAQGLQRPPSFVGVIVAVQGVGAVVGGPTAAPVMRRIGEGWVSAAGMLALACGGALWVAPSLPAVAGGSVLVGFSLPWLVVGAYTLVQRRTPAPLQGRVFSAFDTLVSTPQTISIALGALLISVVDYRVLLAILAGVVTMAGIYLATRPEQRREGGVRRRGAAGAVAGRAPQVAASEPR